MKDKLHSKLLEETLEMINSGKDYDYIKEYIEQMNLSVEKRKYILREVDNGIANRALYQQFRSDQLNKIIIGSGIMVIGVIITFYTYFSLERYYVLCMGAILSGAWILKEAYKNYSVPIDQYRNRFLKKKNFRRF